MEVNHCQLTVARRGNEPSTKRTARKLSATMAIRLVCHTQRTNIHTLLYMHCYTCTAIHALLYMHCYTCTAIHALLYMHCYTCTAIHALLQYTYTVKHSPNPTKKTLIIIMGVLIQLISLMSQCALQPVEDLFGLLIFGAFGSSS